MTSVTPLLLTFNEEANIGRTLAALGWAKQVVIVDSGSTDRTLEIARTAHPNITIVSRAFDSFAAQCNFGLTQIETEWVLSLDADYILTSELIAEIAALNPPPDIAGYSAEFRYCIFGRPLRSTLYPPRTVLYRRQSATYRDEGHGHRVVIDGNIKKLSGKIQHDDRKPFSRWLEAQTRYARIEARHLLENGKEKVENRKEELSLQDRLRKMIFFAPVIMPIYLLFVRGLIIDGWAGWFYVVQRTIAELLLSWRLLIRGKKLEAGR